MPKLITLPQHRVIHGEARKEMDELYKAGERFNLIFADPPFNIGQDYDGYNDRLSDSDYEQLICGFVLRAANLLTVPNGVLCLHGPDELVEPYIRHCRQACLTRVAWIIWHYKFGQCSNKRWINSHAHLLVYTTPYAAGKGSYTQNADEVRVPSDRATKYNDKRIEDYENGGYRMPFTVWSVENDGEGWGRVQGNSKQRRPGHPNQLPENYIERILKYYTNPGDKVLDPFGGSGTTIACCKRLNRLGTTIEISGRSCESIRERLAATKAGA